MLPEAPMANRFRESGSVYDPRLGSGPQGPPLSTDSALARNGLTVPRKNEPMARRTGWEAAGWQREFKNR